MNYDDFFREVRDASLEIRFDNSAPGPAARLSNEALFHLPLIAMTILVLAKGNRKPRIDELGQLVGVCFERTFVGFKGSSQHLGWSANLRVRTVRALTFLEQAGLVEVEKATKRIAATQLGKTVITAATSDTSDLAHTLHVLERQYRNISVEKQISMGFA